MGFNDADLANDDDVPEDELDLAEELAELRDSACSPDCDECFFQMADLDDEIADEYATECDPNEDDEDDDED